MIFIDTNYFLRFFIGEENVQHDEAVKIFERAAEGELELFTSLVVFFEIYWVAASFYDLDKVQIVALLKNILKMEFIKLENRDILTAAIGIYEDTVFDLEDAYNLSYAKTKRAKGFLTFDIKLKKKSEIFI